MSPKKIILNLVKTDKSFTNYDVLFLTRKTHPKTTAKEVRKISADLLKSHRSLANYQRSQIKVGDQKATLFHPKGTSPNSYEANDLTQWEVTRTPDRDGRLSIPKPMTTGMPAARVLNATFGPDFLLIHQGGQPEKSLHIQPRRRDLRINPSTLTRAGILGNRYTLKKSHQGILITKG